MKYIKARAFIYIISILLIFLPGLTHSEIKKASTLIDTKINNIEIRSDSFEGVMKKSLISFTGDVEVFIGNIKITCQKLRLYLRNSFKEETSENHKPQIKEIVATKSVKISKPDVGTATADKAVYDQNSEKIVLTGNPIFKQENSFANGKKITLNGKKITLYLNEYRLVRLVVQGSENQKAKLFTTGKEKR